MSESNPTINEQLKRWQKEKGAAAAICCLGPCQAHLDGVPIGEPLKFCYGEGNEENTLRCFSFIAECLARGGVAVTELVRALSRGLDQAATKGALRPEEIVGP